MSAVHRIGMRSTIYGANIQLNVVVPGPKWGQTGKEFYETAGKFKVLWLLHGGGGDQDDWLNQTGIARYADEKRVLVVMPNGLDSNFAPQPQFAGGFDFPKIFFEELMPYIYNFFPASDKPEDNFLSGLSMGGSGTMLLALMHPEKFGAIAPLSCSLRLSDFLEDYKDMSGQEFRELAMKDRSKFPSEWNFANDPGISIKELNAICKYPKVADFLASDEYTGGRYMEKCHELPRMYYTCGTNDPCYKKGQEFEALAKKLGVTNATFEYVPGYRHEWAFWDLAIKKALEFFGL